MMISKCIHFILDNLALILVVSFLGFIFYQIILLFLLVIDLIHYFYIPTP